MNRKKFTLDILDSPDRVVKLRWDSVSFNLLEILSEKDLPVVVQVEDSEQVSHVDKSFDWKQPLLMFRQQSGVKVYAQTMTEPTGMDSCDYLGNPQVFVIPVEYQGWFELLGRRLDDGNNYGNHTDTGSNESSESIVENWDTLAKVIAAMPVCFMSVHSLKAYISATGDPGKLCYDKTCIPAYSEFQVVGILEDLVTYNKNKQTESKLMRCLECKDSDGNNILIPAESEGQFFATELKKTNRQRQYRGSIYPRAAKLRQLITEEELPIYVRILSGSQNEYPMPNGIIELYEVGSENTIVGCNVSSEGNTMFELPIVGGLLFYRALDNLTSSKNHHVRKAVKYAEEHVDFFEKSVKIRSAFSNSPEFIHIVETPM